MEPPDRPRLDVFREMAMVRGVIDRSRQIRLLEVLRRVLALGLAGLVFALGVFAASPALHKQLHPHDDFAPSDRCAVDLYASGVSLSLALTAPPPPAADWTKRVGDASVDVYLDSPRYLLLPGRGPPLT